MFRKGWEQTLGIAKPEGLHFHELKDLLGHSSLAMVLRYAHLAPEHLRSAVARLDSVMVVGSGRSRAELVIDSAPRPVSVRRAVSSVGRAPDF